MYMSIALKRSGLFSVIVATRSRTVYNNDRKHLEVAAAMVIAECEKIKFEFGGSTILEFDTTVKFRLFRRNRRSRDSWATPH